MSINKGLLGEQGLERAAGASKSAAAEAAATTTSAHSENNEPAGLSVSGLTYAFPGGPPLIEGLDLHIRQGEFVSVLAASGMGKTTLFRLLAGLLEPQAGTIAIGGVNRQQQAAKLGYMPQKDCLMPWRTVLDNAALGMELAGTPKKEARQRVRSCCRISASLEPRRSIRMSCRAACASGYRFFVRCWAAASSFCSMSRSAPLMQ